MVQQVAGSLSDEQCIIEPAHDRCSGCEAGCDDRLWGEHKQQSGWGSRAMQGRQLQPCQDAFGRLLAPRRCRQMDELMEGE